MHRARFVEGAQSFCTFSERATYPASTSICSPTWKFSNPSHLGFLWKLPYAGTIDQIIGHLLVTNSISSSSSLPRGQGVCAESSNPLNHLITRLGPLVTNFHPEASREPPDTAISFAHKKDTYHFEGSKSFRSQKMEVETKSIFLTISHSLSVFLLQETCKLGHC